MIPAYRGQLLRTLTTGGLVVAVVTVSMLTLGQVIEPGAWTVAALQGIVLVALTTNGVRLGLARAAALRTPRTSASADPSPGAPQNGTQGRTGDSRTRDSRTRDSRTQGSGLGAGLGTVASTGAGLVVAFWFVLARFGAPTQRAEVLVGPDAVERVGVRLGTAAQIMRDELAPVDDSLAIGLVAVSGTLLVLLVADLLAASRMPALALVPLLLLWTPALTLMGDVPSWVFVVTVTLGLLLLTVDSAGAIPVRRTGSRDPGVRRAQSRRAGITAVSSFVIAALALGAGAGLSALPTFARGFSQLIATQSGSVQLSDELDLTEPLGMRSGEVVLTYRTSDGAHAGALRLFTLTAFDGTTSQRADLQGGGLEFADDEMLWPGGFSPTAPPREVTVTMRTLRSPELPLVVDPRTVVIEGDEWEYYNIRDEVRGERRTREGDVYTLGVYDRALTADGLRGATGPDPGSSGYTQVPVTAHDDDIARLAEEVAGAAPTRYDQVMALQSFLRDDGRFVYEPDTAYDDSVDPVWDFLQQREGYCVQFASAMMVMARSLGIPTRLGVGYLPGDQAGSGEWTVTGEESHAWPEVFFPGSGWVRFEPTPAVQTGLPPRYADPGLVPPAPVPSEVPEEVPAEPTPTQAAPDPTAPATADADAGTRGVMTERGMPFWVWLVTGLGGLLLVAGAGVWLMRRRADVEVLDPELAWSRVVAVLAEREVVLPPSTTLRRAPAAIDSAVRARTGEPLDGDVAEQLVALAAAAESERYARDYVRPSAERLEALTGTVTEALTTALSRRGQERRG